MVTRSEDFPSILERGRRHADLRQSNESSVGGMVLLYFCQRYNIQDLCIEDREKACVERLPACNQHEIEIRHDKSIKTS